MRWPARHPHVVTSGMLKALHALSRFVGLLDWRSFAPRAALDDIDLQGEHADQTQVFAIRDDHQALLWLLRESEGAPGVLSGRKPIAVRFSLRGLQAGDYQVVAWDTVHGREAGCWKIRCDKSGRLGASIELPNDIAIAIRPAK